MTTYELSRDMMVTLKQDHLMRDGNWPSWDELVHADELVSDEEIHEHYSGTDFVEEDFPSL